MGAPTWKAHETEIVVRLYGKVPATEIAKHLPGRTRASVASHAFALGVKAGRTGKMRGRLLHDPENWFGCSCRKPGRHWTARQLDLLEDQYGRVPLKVLCRRLRRSESAVKSKASRLRIRWLQEFVDLQILEQGRQ